MAEVTIRYTTKVAGHPDQGSQITVERTEMVEGLLAAGFVVEIATEPTKPERPLGPEKTTNG